jgi:cytolysin-activating lysine-acyltransferase
MTAGPFPRAALPPLPPSPDEFLTVLGQVTWLMGLSEAHRDLPLREIETRIQVPLLLKQVRVYTEGKRPIAALTWAGVSEGVKQALSFPQYRMQLADWRSGPEIVVIDCISPFADRSKFEALFRQQTLSDNAAPARAQDE